MSTLIVQYENGKEELAYQEIPNRTVSFSRSLGDHNDEDMAGWLNVDRDVHIAQSLMVNTLNIYTNIYIL